MCEKCWQAAKKHYPELSDGDIGHLLWGATCFPFGEPEQVEANLIELREKTDGSLEAALCFAEAELDRAHSDFMKQQQALKESQP